jgi:hypothetical protein
VHWLADPQWGCNENFPLRLIRHNHLSIFAKINFAFSQKLHVKYAKKFCSNEQMLTFS